MTEGWVIMCSNMTVKDKKRKQILLENWPWLSCMCVYVADVPHVLWEYVRSSACSHHLLIINGQPIQTRMLTDRHPHTCTNTHAWHTTHSCKRARNTQLHTVHRASRCAWMNHLLRQSEEWVRHRERDREQCLHLVTHWKHIALIDALKMPLRWSTTLSTPALAVVFSFTLLNTRSHEWPYCTAQQMRLLQHAGIIWSKRYYFEVKTGTEIQSNQIPPPT